MTDTPKHSGGCTCGVIRYQVEAPLGEMIQCHCTDCQRASGAGASVNLPVPLAALRFTQGTPRVFSRVVDSGRTLHRAFCGDCGSPIYSQRDNAPDRVMLKAGTLDDNDGARIVMNIWTRSARPWMRWDRDLPSHEQNRPL